MGRREDLEQSIRESYEIIREYEAVTRLSERPEEKIRARRRVQEQRALMEGYLSEYLSLVDTDVPEDIAQIAHYIPSLKQEVADLKEHPPRKRERRPHLLNRIWVIALVAVVATAIGMVIFSGSLYPWLKARISTPVPAQPPSTPAGSPAVQLPTSTLLSTATPGIASTPIASSTNTPVVRLAKTPIVSPTATFAKGERMASEAIVEAPSLISDAVVAGGGKYVILRMQTRPGLAVYDADEREIVHTFGLASDNFLYSAGGNIVLVYYPENNLLQTWNLDTFEKLKTVSNPKGSIVTYMTMGHSSGDRALIRYAVGTEALDRAGMYLLDTATLQEISVGGENGMPFSRNRSYRDYIHQRADGTMQIVSEWATSHTPSGLGLLVLAGHSWTTVYDHTSVGYIAVGDDGFTYTQSGGIYNSELTQIGRIPQAQLIPGIGGALVLGISENGSMQVYASGSITPLGPAGDFPGLSEGGDTIPGSWATTPFVLDRHIVFDPKHGRLILIPPEHDRIIQRDFDLEKLLQSSGVDYLVVTSTPSRHVEPGETWRYKVEVLSSAAGIRSSLELGPEGMVIENGGTLVWNAPADFTGPEKVVVLVENRAGESTYHNFELLAN